MSVYEFWMSACKGAIDRPKEQIFAAIRGSAGVTVSSTPAADGARSIATIRGSVVTAFSLVFASDCRILRDRCCERGYVAPVASIEPRKQGKVVAALWVVHWISMHR